MLGLLILITCMLTSCQGAGTVPSYEVGYAVITGNEKRLDAEDNAVITVIEYRATPLFSYSEGYHDSLEGATAEFVPVNFSGAVSDLLGPFSAGKWHFEIRALNSNGNLLYVSEQTVYIKPGRANVIRFEIERTGGFGTLDFNIRAPKISASGTENLTADVDGVPFTDFTKTVETSYITFRGTVRVASGTHRVAFSYAEGGEAMSLNVTENETVYITGTLTPAYYEQISSGITQPVRIRGHVEGNTETEPSAPLSLTFVIDEGACASSDVSWYLNGGDTGKKGFAVTLTIPDEGNFVVTAVADKVRTPSLTDADGNESEHVIHDTASDVHIVKVRTMYPVTVTRNQVLMEGTPRINGVPVKFPYSTKVARLHPDGCYTPYELGFDEP